MLLLPLLLLGCRWGFFAGKPLVLLGCPRVVREKMLENLLFFIGFRSEVVRGQPARFGRRGGGGAGTHLPQNRPSFTIETALARPRSFASPRPRARTNAIGRVLWRIPPAMRRGGDLSIRSNRSAGGRCCVQLIMTTIVVMRIFVRIRRK